MLVKIHKSYRNVVAVCDSELLGKRFEEGNMQIEIKEHFFSGEEKTSKEVLELMKIFSAEDANFNIVGNKAVETALKAGIINKQGVKKVQGVPVALVLL